MAPKWRNPYDEATERPIINREAIDFTGDPGMTLQAPQEDTDLNVIMARFGLKDGSRIPRWQSPEAIYADFTDIPDNPVELAEALRQGELAFAQLPAQIRRQFDSGAQLYQWLHDPTNVPEAIKLGLLENTSPQVTLADVNTTLKGMVSTSTSSDKEKLVPTGGTK